MENKLTSEDLKNKISDIAKKFDEINEIIRAKTNSIEELRKDVIDLQDEQKRLQGEYRFVLNLAKEFNLLDDSDISEVDKK